VNTSIGQGYVAVSPMLMAQVYQQIINDGELYKSVPKGSSRR